MVGHEPNSPRGRCCRDSFRGRQLHAACRRLRQAGDPEGGCADRVGPVRGEHAQGEQDPGQRAVRKARRAGRLHQARRRRRVDCSHQVPGYGRQDRLADHQPGRTGRIRGQRRRVDVGEPAGPTSRTVRLGRLRSARRRFLQARGVVQLRRRQRRAARRSASRLQPSRCRPHRTDDQEFRPALRRQDGQGVPGQCRHRQRGQRPRLAAGRAR